MYRPKSALCKEGVKEIKGRLFIFFYIFKEFFLCLLEAGAAHMDRATVNKHRTIGSNRPEFTQIYYKAFMAHVKAPVNRGDYTLHASVFPILVVLRVYEYASVIFYNKKYIVPRQIRNLETVYN
jgi:hypothetical protein